MVVIHTRRFGYSGELHLISGGLTLFACVADFCWQSPAYPNPWDPIENGYSIRHWLTWSAIIYLLLSSPAALIFWRYEVLGLFTRALHMLFSFITLILLLHSNSIETTTVYYSSIWYGSHWIIAQRMLIWSAMLCSIGYLISHQYTIELPLEQIGTFLKRTISKVHLYVSTCCNKGVKSSEVDDEESMMDVPLICSSDEENSLEDNESSDVLDLEDESFTDSSSDSSGFDSRYTTDEFSICALIQCGIQTLIQTFHFLFAITHAPLMFGCGAYLIALAISVCALTISYYSSEPYTTCLGRTEGGYLTPLVNNVNTNWEHSTNGFHLQWFDETKQFRVYHQSNPSNPILSSVPGKSFIRLGIVNYGYHDRDIFQPQSYTRYETAIDQSLDSIEIQHNNIVLKGLISLEFSYERFEIPYNLTFSSTSKQQLDFNLIISKSDTFFTNVPVQQLFLTFESDENEEFYGLGKQYSYRNMKGGCVPIVAQEQGVGRGLQPITFFLNRFQQGTGGSWQSTYTAIPQFLSSVNRSFTLNNVEKSIFDFSFDDSVTVSVLLSKKIPQLSGRMVQSNSLKESVALNAKMNGTPKLQPRFLQNGAIVEVNGGTLKVEKMVELLQQAGVPLAAVYISDWTGSVESGGNDYACWSWEVDQILYPRWNELIAKLKTSGVKVFTYINPHLMDVSHKSNVRRNFYAEATKKNCIVRNVSIQRRIGNIRYGTVDLFSSMCREWFAKEVIRSSMVSGASQVAGWFADMGEGIELMPRRENSHNNFATMWTKTNTIAQELVSNDVVFFMRAANLGSSQYVTSQFLGEQMTSWDRYDGLQSVITASINAGLSGMPLVHSGIGGYDSVKQGPFKLIRSEELLVRWMEFSAFADSIFRTALGVDQSVLQVWSSEYLLDALSRFAKVHVAFSSYRTTLLKQARDIGYPIIRPMAFHSPDMLGYDHQFFIGEHVIMCPIVEPSRTSIPCTLPKHSGTWIQLCSKDQQNTAKQDTLNVLQCNAPLGIPCIFYHESIQDMMVDVVKIICHSSSSS